MTPVQSVNSYFQDYRTVSPVQVSPATQSTQISRPPTQDVVLNNQAGLLPPDQGQALAEQFRNINILALEAAEPGQSFDERQRIQNDASDIVSSLEDIFENLSQQNLDLFIAAVEVQVPDLSSLNSPSDNTSFFSDFSNTVASSSTLEALLQIDLRSEQGILSALDLTSSVLDSLSFFNTGDSLLEGLVDISISNAVVDSFSDALDSGSEEEPGTDEAADFPQLTEPAAPPGTDPPTIIDIVG